MALDVNDLLEVLGALVENTGLDNLFLPIKPVLRCPLPPRKDNPHSSGFFALEEQFKKTYELDNLTDLIEKLKNKNLALVDEMDYAEKYSARYLVTPEWDILFAPEGAPNHLTPSHKEMNQQCLAAGNIFYNDDYSCITGINNQSGDFKPSMISIIWSIIKLQESGLSLGDTLSINLFREDGPAIQFEISKTDLIMLAEFFAPIKQHLLDNIETNQQLQLEAPSTPR